MNVRKTFAALCRWPARIGGTLFVILMVVIGVGEGIDKEFATQISFLGMVLVATGILLGWRFELTGGIIALAGFFLVFIPLFFGEGLALTGFFIALALPGVLYVTSAFLRRYLEKHKSTQPTVSREGGIQ